MEAIVGMAIRLSVMYLYALFLVRLSGKRSIGQQQGTDLAATVIVGDMFDDVIWGEIPLAMGMIGISVVILLHILLETGIRQSALVRHIVAGRPALLLRDGQSLERRLARERLSQDVLASLLREHEIEDQTVVAEGRLEDSGQLSVIRQSSRQPVEKGQRPALLAWLAQRPSGRRWGKGDTREEAGW